MTVLWTFQRFHEVPALKQSPLPILGDVRLGPRDLHGRRAGLKTVKPVRGQRRRLLGPDLLDFQGKKGYEIEVRAGNRSRSGKLPRLA